MKKIIVLYVLLPVLAVILAGCGGGAPTQVEVVMDDFSFTPDTFEIAAGREITISVTNTGKEEHEFVIFKAGFNAGDTFGDEDEDNIFWEVEALPGKTVTETFTAPASGVYYVTCGIEDHLEKGMSGYLVVK